MANTLEINISGLEPLIRKLKDSVSESLLKKSLYQGALSIGIWSKKNRLSGPRPRYLGVVTGRLRSSISASKAQKRGNIYETKIGTNVVYAPTHEFGDPRRNIPERSFLRSAIKEKSNQQEVLKILTENINEALEKK